MTTLADRTIAGLRAEHDLLAAVVPDLNDDQLAGPSGAAEWTVAQVLSHLGSGAEITLAGLDAALGTAPLPADDFNQGVWDRWNATAPRDQATGFLRSDSALVERLESLDGAQRANLQLSVGFLPFPLSVAGFAGMRLSEAIQHSWDARVGVDPGATLTDESAAVLLEQFAGDLGFLLGFVGKPDAVADRVVLELGGSGLSLVIDDAVAVASASDQATATLSGAPEAAVRLIGGRLTPAHTPAGVEVSGNVTLDGLRAVFPGF